MKNQETKLNPTTTTLKSTMHHTPSEQATVFALAAETRLRRPYGLYGNKRRKAKKAPVKHSQPKRSPSQIQGQAYEQQAIRFLQSQGMILIAQNLRCQSGEIDCVMLHRQTLVFVEVRQRTQATYGSAAASVTRQKQHRIKQSAKYFLPQLCRQLSLKQIPLCRFDVLSFDGKEQSFQWLRHAFV